MRSRKARRIRGNRKYGCAKKEPARKGIVSLTVWLLAFIFLVMLVMAAYVEGGAAQAVIGAFGIISAGLAVFGIWIGFDSLHEPDRAYGVSRVAIGLNIILLILFIIIFVMGAAS